jgi:hypothetical protein
MGREADFRRPIFAPFCGDANDLDENLLIEQQEIFLKRKDRDMDFKKNKKLSTESSSFASLCPENQYTVQILLISS